MNWLHELVVILAPILSVIASAIFSQIMRKKYQTEIHLTLNSRLDQLVRTATEKAYAEGQLKGTVDTHETMK